MIRITYRIQTAESRLQCMSFCLFLPFLPLLPLCDGFVATAAAPIATGWNDPLAGWELHPLKINTLPRRTLGLAPPASCCAPVVALRELDRVLGGHTTCYWPVRDTVLDILRGRDLPWRRGPGIPLGGGEVLQRLGCNGTMQRRGCPSLMIRAA